MGKEQGNMKEMFRQAIIGGYRKKEVEEYIYFLINETENLKAENISAKKEQKKEILVKEEQYNAAVFLCGAGQEGPGHHPSGGI